MYSDDLKLPESDRLPSPSGYKILVAIPQIEAKTTGGVLLPDKLREAEQTASILGYVLKLGPDAYSDPSRTSAPWCKEGDWVIFRSYSGTRFKIDGIELRLVNDDTIDAVVTDPRGYKRA